MIGYLPRDKAEEEFLQQFSGYTRIRYSDNGLLLAFCNIATINSRSRHPDMPRIIRDLEKASLLEFVVRDEEQRLQPIKRRFPFINPSQFVRLTEKGLEFYKKLREAESSYAMRDATEGLFYVPWTQQEHAFD